VVLLISALVSSAIAGYVQMEDSVRQFSSRAWLKETQMKTDKHEIQAVFVLKHDEIAIKEFETTLIELSTPSSPKYGQWLKPQDIINKISPSAEKVKVVTDFVESFGVKGDKIRVSKYNDLVFVTMPISIAESMFRTEFALFRSTLQREVVIPRITKPYFLPTEVASVVSLVDEIMRFPAIRNSPKSYGYESSTDPAFSSCGTKCAGFTTPSVLESAYSFTQLTSAAPGNSMSVAEFQYQYYDQTDLDTFSSACGVTSTVATTIGGNNPNICTNLGGCVEALLDIEYIDAVANPIPLTVIYSSSFSLLNWVNGVISMANPPLVHSVSYGNDEVQQTSVAYMNSCNVQFMMAGSLGLSILFASGDQGVWGRSGVGATFNPDFPAGSPYVTAVGGTDFSTKSVVGSESVWSCGGGGFSDTFAAPSWQTDVVAAYLSAAAASGVLPDSSLFNATGRGYPDVSALGGQVNPYCVAYSGGSFGGVAGTSASCPVVAGIFAQLNNVRLLQGKSSLGFLNPLIYANPTCFNDVKDGSMNNCNAGTTGFATIPGWDPATGFGSPNYACLAKVVV